MKRSDAPKPIDPAVLKKILGGAQPVVEDKNQKTTVIEQSSFYSFYHS